MNERIRELAEQANLSADKTYQFDPKDGFKIQEWDKIRLAKFAELIVAEMYDFMCKATDNDGAWPSSKEVKQHFGLDGMSTEDKKTLIKELLGVKND